MVRSTDLEKQEYEENVKYVTKECYDFLSKSQIFGGEILINKIGNQGRTYLMPQLDKPCSLGMNLFMIRLNHSTYNEEYIWAYFNSKLGENIIKRKINGTVPLTIDKEAIKSLYIPVVSCDFQLKIKNLVLRSNNILENAKNQYNYAINILLNSLNIGNWVPTTENITSKKLSHLSKESRFDAEYYLPKYDELFEKLKSYQTKRLSEIVSIQKSIEPGSEAYEKDGIPFIRVANLTKYGFTDSDIYLSPEKYKDVIRPKKDTILLSKDGSVGIAYKVDSDMDIITSGAILHLSLINREVMPDYLTLVLNSIVVKMQAERDAGGSIIQHWKPSEIGNVIIPILDPEAQQEITNKIRDSFKLRRESERLLNLAKAAVEIAIEQNEDKAVELLNQSIWQ